MREPLSRPGKGALAVSSFVTKALTVLSNGVTDVVTVVFIVAMVSVAMFGCDESVRCLTLQPAIVMVWWLPAH